MSEPLADQPLRVVNPSDGFRFFAASELMNLPAMYLYREGGEQFIRVVARGFDHAFAADDMEDAMVFYLIAARQNGYLL
jgi:hypothetical protein